MRIDDKKSVKAIIDALRINPVDYISDDDLNLATNLVDSFDNDKYSKRKNAESAENNSEAKTEPKADNTKNLKATDFVYMVKV